MNRLNPKTWPPYCTLLFAMWLVPACAANAVFFSPIPGEDILQSVHAMGGLGVPRDIGWPFSYGWIVYAHQSPPEWEFWFGYLALNLIAITATQFSMLLILHDPKLRFSLRTLFVIFTIISIVIFVGYGWLDFDLYGIWPTVYLIYLMPTVTVISGLPDLLDRHRENKTPDNDAIDRSGDVGRVGL